MAKTKIVRLLHVNSRDVIELTQEEYASPKSIFRNWPKAPDYCVCKDRCVCDRFEKMTDEQIRLLTLQLKDIQKNRKIA